MEYYSKGIAFVNGKRDLTFIRSIYPYSFLSIYLTLYLPKYSPSESHFGIGGHFHDIMSSHKA
jgi:hypothetical protein